MSPTVRSILANSPYLVIVALLAIVPAVVTNLYHIQVMIFIGIYTILTLSLNLLNGYVGLLSIGHAAFYGVGAYASAKLVMTVGLPFPHTLAGHAALVAVVQIGLAPEDDAPLRPEDGQEVVVVIGEQIAFGKGVLTLAGCALQVVLGDTGTGVHDPRTGLNPEPDFVKGRFAGQERPCIIQRGHVHDGDSLTGTVGDSSIRSLQGGQALAWLQVRK